MSTFNIRLNGELISFTAYADFEGLQQTVLSEVLVYFTFFVFFDTSYEPAHEILVLTA